MPIWMIISRGRYGWSYVKPEAPCWKGEINVSLLMFSITIGWQAGGEKK